jgi:hypothetical protein
LSAARLFLPMPKLVNLTPECPNAGIRDLGRIFLVDGGNGNEEQGKLHETRLGPHLQPPSKRRVKSAEAVNDWSTTRLLSIADVVPSVSQYFLLKLPETV